MFGLVSRGMRDEIDILEYYPELIILKKNIRMSAVKPG